MVEKMLISELEWLLKKIKQDEGDIEVWEGCDRCIGGPFTQWFIENYSNERKKLYLTHNCGG